MAPAELVRAFERQVEWCNKLDARFTADVVATLADQLRAGGALVQLLPDWPGDPSADAVPLRVCGALHALALDENSPFAALYPPRVATLDRAAFVRALDASLASDRGHFERMLAQPPQTNEIGRSAVLLGGFAEIARATQRPLALLELGASAGLNLRWDRFRFELGPVSWGERSSPVRIASQWRGALPALPTAIEVASRAACDEAPLDPRSDADRRRLLAYVWPEQRERVMRLRAAIDLARADGLAVECADGAEWLARRLAQPRPGAATVVYHSIFWQYLAETTKAGLRKAIESAAKAATADAPFAWLTFEFDPATQRPELTLTQWPGGVRRRLATAHPHGAFVDWIAASDGQPSLR